MTKQEMLKTLKRIAWERTQYDMEDVDELEDLYDRWNNLVSPAEKLGISHSDMRKIWNGVGLSADWRG